MAGQRSSSSSFSFTYDVFLSFRGEDTRYGFTGHLLKALRDSGIHTFLEDDKELRKGDEITTTILEAIKESRIAIIVFSENYAASSLCLEELASILDQRDRNDLLVFPVFYDVDPSDVRKQRGTYGEALARHEEKFKDNNQKVLKWRNALHQLANLFGWHFKQGDESEFQFIENIVKAVSRKINHVHLHVVDYPVGLESQLKNVCSLLELESNIEVLMVGIYGVDGIGKSTLARAVYNSIAHQFEGLCFLDRVRESSNILGLVPLQEKLLSNTVGLNIKFGDVSEGIPIIKQTLHKKKVLLILGDVDKLKQLQAMAGGLDWFGLGSRVIITTRDKRLLTIHGIERTYEVNALKEKEALDLLKWKVFKNNKVDPSYNNILKRAVTYASGLPLALEVVGSNLSGKKHMKELESLLDRYERIPYIDIQMTLKTSFDALEQDEKSVFLDIACCFKGYELADVEDILYAHYGHNMKHQIGVLVEKSLVSISWKGKVTLHPLIERMGKEIVRQESPKNPEKRSRLWYHKDIVEVLEDNTGTSQTEIIHLDSPLGEVIEWDGEAFKKMENLKTLIIKNCHFSKAAKHLPSSLRVLEWWEYPSPALPSNFDPTKVYMRRCDQQGVMADQRSSSSFSFTYDVFLSFHDGDTRFGFTGHLLKALNDKGIRTFRDEQLRRENEITPTLVKVIEESRIAIIVFSENYAASSLCLEVLASILDNFQGKRWAIIPVYYDMAPYDVRHRRGAYGRALEMHEEKFKDNNHKVQKWRNTLHQVACLSGFRFRHGEEYEYQFIEKIVEEVSRSLIKKIDHAPLHNAEHNVGLKSRLDEMYSLLELGSDGVVMVGMYGAGGIGKTTLARAVYNTIADQFEGRFFLDGVRENSNIHGLVHLQNMLLSEIIGLKDIQLGNVNKGASIIKDRLHQKKVLLILDDVNTLEQLEALVGESDWFGPGSRVIITTRDRHLLAFHGVERIYEVQALNHQDSLQLLSHQVFKQGNFDPEHREILDKLVSYASGLPLALKVIGSYLFGKSEDEWTKALHRFKRIPPNEIQTTLKIGFDALREDEQSVFLDIACCFKGYKMEKALDILCAHHGYNVKFHIEALIAKSLASISSDGKVTLHPLIEDMGKEIVRQESPKEPGKRTRLWFHEDIVQVLKNNTGTSNIQIINLDSSLAEGEEAIEWDGEAFKKMENLRTLIIRKCHFSKAPNYLPNSLRVLKWREYSSQELPSTFDTKQLDICKLKDMDSVSLTLEELPKTSRSDPEASHISLSVPEETPSDDPKRSQTPPDDPKGSQTPPDDPEGSPTVQSVQRGSLEWILILVFLASSVIGLLCNAFSPHFGSKIHLWKQFRFTPFVVFFLAVVAIKLCLYRYRNIHWLIKCCICYGIFLCISVYSFFYERAMGDKDVGGKPGTLSVVSNAMFALASLSLSKLFEAGVETGIFSYYLQCLTIQLLTISWRLIFVSIIIGIPLFDLHFSKKPFLLTLITRWFGTIPGWFGTNPLWNWIDEML